MGAFGQDIQIKPRCGAMCGNGGMDLDWELAFKPLDGDGYGVYNGRLLLQIQPVPCGDPPEGEGADPAAAGGAG